MKIIFADDHALFRDALSCFMMQAEPGMQILPANDLHGVMEHLQVHSDVDLIILDLKMPGMNGLRGLEKTISVRPNIPVVIMSGLAEEDDVENAIAKGARGYFPKTMPGNAVLHGLKSVLGGAVFLPVDHNTNRVMSSYDHGAERKAEIAADPSRIPEDKNLTPREREVLGYLMQGASNKDIARALDLQVVTVKLHVRGVCRKLGASNRTQAVILAQQAADKSAL